MRYSRVAIGLFVLGAGQWVWHSVNIPLSVLIIVFLSCAAAGLLFWRSWAVLICAFTCGVLLGAWQIEKRIAQQIPEVLDGERVSATWLITSLPKMTQHGVTFEAQILALGGSATLPQKRMLISWYRPTRHPKAGEQWRGVLKLKRPRGSVNFGGFDYQAYLLGQGFSATATVKGQPVFVQQKKVWAGHRAALVEPMMRMKLSSVRFFSALLVADKSQLTAEDWQILQRTGTVHLMAISGLHIGMIATWAFWVVTFIARFAALIFQKQTLWMYRYLPPACSILAASWYAALANFSIPTLRALLACVLINLAVMAGRKFSLLSLLCLCAAWVICFEPFAFMNSGFWLSFSAVAVLLLVLAHRPQKSRWSWLTVQGALLVGMCVPLLVLNLPVSLFSPVANMIAVPVVSFLVVPSLFLSTIVEPMSSTVHEFLLMAGDKVFILLWQGLTWLAAHEGAILKPMFDLNLLTYFWLSCAVVSLLLPLGMHLRGLGMVLLLGVFFYQPTKEEQVRVTIMDVGQGLSVVVETPALTWVYDAGAKFSDTFDIGDRVIAPFLREKGIRDIGLIISHDDQDHAGGAEALAEQFNTFVYWAGEASTSATANDEPCIGGQTWQGDQVKLEVLWPLPHEASQQPPLWSGNDASCVVLLSIFTPGQVPQNVFRVLLTGDISRKVEKRLLPYLPRQIDLLVSPHHGSRTSSSFEFVEHIKPRYVVHSAGYKHHYGHPHPKVRARYERVGSQQWNTADAGAVRLEVDLLDGDHRIDTARSHLAKPWYN